MTTHPYIPTDDQMVAMGKFVDALDLTGVGEEAEDGFAYIVFPEIHVYIPLFAEADVPGMTHACPTTQPSIAPNRPNSTPP